MNDHEKGAPGANGNPAQARPDHGRPEGRSSAKAESEARDERPQPQRPERPEQADGDEPGEDSRDDGTERSASSPSAHASGPSANAARRGGTRAEERIAALDTSGAGLAEEVERLSAQLEAAQQRVAEAEAGWQRARADYANLKRRTEEERADIAGQASDRLLIRVLDLADDFDLAVEHVPADAKGSPWVEGITAIDRKLRTLLEAEGIKAMEGEGEPFDPHTQQAISYEDTADVPDGTVIKVIQRGYTIRDRVLRPALVAVARNDEPTTQD